MDRHATDSQLANALPRIGVVGPCGAGKSTLIQRLEARGHRCRHIAQEHSYVQQMWQRISNPDLLIYLHASFDVCTTRRKLNWLEGDYLEQLRRLAHAREHADLIVDTDDRSPDQVMQEVTSFLGRRLGEIPV